MLLSTWMVGACLQRGGVGEGRGERFIRVIGKNILWSKNICARQRDLRAILTE